MTRKQKILKELDKYLHPVNTTELRLSMAVPRGITFCSTVHRIVHDYNSTQENEDKVCELIAALAKIHFR